MQFFFVSKYTLITQMITHQYVIHYFLSGIGNSKKTFNNRPQTWKTFILLTAFTIYQ